MIEKEIVLRAGAMLCAGFVSVTLLQSGFDKVLDFKGNLSWMKEQFSKTFLRNTIPFFLVVLAIGETAAGGLCAGGILAAFFYKSVAWIVYGLLLAGSVLLMLLFGQRISKEYAGAASLTGYFLVVMAGLAMAALLS